VAAVPGFKTEGGESMLPKVHCGQSGVTSLPGFRGVIGDVER